MRKFKVIVTRTDEYNIEIDESIWTPEEIKDWGKTFWGGETLKDVVAPLAIAWMNQGASNFKEGFGYVKQVDSVGTEESFLYRSEDGEVGIIPEEKYCLGIKVEVVSEDDYETQIKELI